MKEIVFNQKRRKKCRCTERLASCATAKTCWTFTIKISRFKSQIFSILALCINTSNVMFIYCKALVHVDSWVDVNFVDKYFRKKKYIDKFQNSWFLGPKKNSC